jgi:hypothetical protein
MKGLEAVDCTVDRGIHKMSLPVDIVRLQVSNKSKDIMCVQSVREVT